MGLLVYDGDCGFCTGCAEWVQRRVGNHHRVQPWQFLDSLEEHGLTPADVDASAWWILDNGSRRGGVRAAAAAFQAIGGAWRLLGLVLDLPGVRHVAHIPYVVIARNRHRLPGGTPACRLPRDH